MLLILYREVQIIKFKTLQFQDRAHLSAYNVENQSPKFQELLMIHV